MAAQQAMAAPHASMAADQADSADRRGRWSTTVLCTLAFVAVANLAINSARIASTGMADHSSIRLALEAAAALLLPLLAFRQLHKSATPANAAVLEPDSPRNPNRNTLRKWFSVARWLLTPVLIVVAVVSISGQWDTVTGAVGQLAHLHWRYVRLSVYAEAFSTVAFALVGWILLRSRGARLTLRSMIALSLASNALSVSMPAGQAVAATFSFDQLRRRGVSRGTAVRVLISTVVIVSVDLALLLAVGVVLAGRHGPAAPFRTVVEVVAAVLAIVASALILTRRVRWPRFAPAPRALLAAVPAALGNWISDCGCFVAAILAAGGHVPWSALLVIYGVGQIAENLPITPGGVGVVEGTLSVLLVAYGMHATTAVTAVLVYRIVSFWVQVPIGLATAAVLQFKLRRSGRPSLASARTAMTPAPLPS